MAAFDRLQEAGASCRFYDDYDHEGAYQHTYAKVQASDYDCAVLSPGVKPDHPLLRLLADKGVPTISEPDLGYLFFDGKIIAVTGTNGKTTTVKEIEAMLSAAGVKARAVGNVGVPFCSLSAGVDVAVVEMSSFQCHQSVFFRPYAAAITNIAPDHIEWHGTMHAYREAKCKLIGAAKVYALNADDPDLPRVEGKMCYAYSMADETCTAFVSKRALYVRDGDNIRCLAGVEQLPLAGKHNVYNVLCALSLAVATVGYRPQFVEGILGYKGERMRVEQLTFTKPFVYNDSKGTNASATIAALRQMVGSTALLLGGYDKGEDFTRLFMSLGADVVLVCFGAAGKRIAEAAADFGISRCDYVPTLAEAVKKALQADTDNVLFSPACSSFDAYTSYVERGIDFEKQIRRYL